MFGKARKCGICGEKFRGKSFTQLADGEICPMCARICSESVFISINDVRQAWGENDIRIQQFKETSVISSMLCSYIFIDFEHQWAYLSETKKPKFKPIIFHFSEIGQYAIKQLGAKTVTKTKTKGGIGRAIVGGALAGPVGAIAGAATAKTESETKTVGGNPFLILELNINGLKTKISLSNPPFEAEKVLNAMIEA